ncbi:MAG: LuxR C-terminal-related transcriptional regulator [Actinomycetota bacterium]|nr:LuxR C-terminal-related transcriptional regulator [Actinomycetota bacterium]
MTGITAIDPHVQGSLADLLDVLGRTGDAMVAINGSFGIIAWNDAATELLGYTAEEALGRPCHEILCWRDRCGDAVCDGTCPAADPGEPDEVIGATEVLGRSASGRTLWLSASTIVPPIELRDECRLVHLIREVSLPPELERVIVERLDGWSPGTDQRDDRLDVLTPREREVLQLLTEGLDGARIAKRLFLSQATVRNHIQHILAKLGVHSRVEAVAFALRRR